MKVVINFVLTVAMIYKTIKDKKYLIIYFLILGNICMPNQETLSFINFNIHGLSPIINGFNDSKRVKHIFDKSVKYDIVFFQENWVYQEILPDFFDDHSIIIGERTKFCKKNNPKRSSGLNIIVKNNIKIKKYNEYLFEQCNGIIAHSNDCLASKGFIYLEILLTNDILNLYVTHLDAGNSKNDIEVRKSQLVSLTNNINNIKNNGPLIICGDFNIDYYAEENIINDFLYKLDLKVLKWDNNATEMIDYVLYRDGMNNSITFIDYGIFPELINYSDHPPIEFNVIFEGVK